MNAIDDCDGFFDCYFEQKTRLEEQLVSHKKYFYIFSKNCSADPLWSAFGGG
ncbi:MAG: hypothetical protein HYV59_06125 [Planctomycetes bacterium]|nr:hypothetical protein [Planctomycetota bacterium]